MIVTFFVMLMNLILDFVILCQSSVVHVIITADWSNEFFVGSFQRIAVLLGVDVAVALYSSLAFVLVCVPLVVVMRLAFGVARGFFGRRPF